MKRRRLLHLLLILIVLTGAAPIALASASSTTVTLNIFSGRPDPTWALRAAQVKVLQTLLEALPAGDPADPPVRLGYRGFTVTGNDIGEVYTFDGLVRWTTGDAVRWLYDARRSLEIWLLDSAGDHLSAEIANLLLEELTGGFAIYLPAENLTPSEVAHADLETLALQPVPALNMHDFLVYDANTHEFELTDDASARLATFDIPVPFVACVGREAIYPGAFWASYSSMAYDESVVIDVLYGQMDLPMQVQLGYPASPELYTGEDLRGDPRILAVFEAAGKLKEH